MPPVAVLLLHNPHHHVLWYTSECLASGVVPRAGGPACFVVSEARCPGHLFASVPAVQSVLLSDRWAACCLSVTVQSCPDTSIASQVP